MSRESELMHTYRARQPMPVIESTGARWEHVDTIERGELFDASDHWTPGGTMVLLLADGRGYVSEWCDEMPEVIR